MTPAEMVDRLVAVAPALSLTDVRRLLDALVEPATDLDTCTGNYVARAAQAVADRVHARVAVHPTD